MNILGFLILMITLWSISDKLGRIIKLLDSYNKEERGKECDKKSD
jgi:hypothetical protein